MAENPLNWNDVQRVIDAALRKHRTDMESGVVGWSDVMYIYNALVASGYLIDQRNESGNWGDDPVELKRIIAMFESRDMHFCQELADLRWTLHEYRRICPEEMSKEAERLARKRRADIAALKVEKAP